MYETLKENGWRFKFKAEAISPRGFTYVAEGETPEEAFLKAFGSWRNELFTSSKAPIVAKKAATVSAESSSYASEVARELVAKFGEKLFESPPEPQLPEIKSKRNYQKRKLEIMRDAWTKPLRLYQRHLKPISNDPKLNWKRTYGRLYMRSYRDRLRFQKQSAVV